MKLSLIIPVYNAEKYLRQCLHSVLNQRLRALEVIAVDDASTDSSPQILSSLAQKDKRLHIITLPENSGAGHARNCGLKAASGKFIGFIDSDDWVESNMFPQLLKQAQQHRTEIAACFTRCVHYQSQKRVYSPYFAGEEKHLAGPEFVKPFSREDIIGLLPFISVVPWNKIYSRALIERSGAKFAEGLAHEDLTFYLAAMGSARSLVLCREECYNYRVFQSDSLSQKTQPAVFEDIFTVLEICDEILIRNGGEKEIGKSYSHFKTAYLLTCLNRAFCSVHFNKRARKQYFSRVKKQLAREVYPKKLSGIERFQYQLVKWNFSLLFQLKVKLDLIKEQKMPTSL